MIRIGTSLDRRQIVIVGTRRAKLHNLVAFAMLAGLTLILACWSVAHGATDMTFFDVVRVLTGGSGTDAENFAIWQVRLPRIAIGFMAGWCIALTGAMMQSLAQNPLADPGLLGLSQGALVMIMIFIVFFPAIPTSLYPLGALAGGLAVGLLLLWLTGRNNAGGAAILLMGIAVETTLSSITAMLLLHTKPEVSYELGIWLNGSLFFSNWDAVGRFAFWFVLTIPVILCVGKSLKAFDLGDQVAMSLGEPAYWSKPIILILAVLMMAAAVSQVGPLVFLGVLAPHLAGFLSSATGRSRLFLAALMGGALVVAADTITRILSTTLYLPIGLTIIAIGAPLFILTLRLSSLRRTL